MVLHLQCNLVHIFRYYAPLEDLKSVTDIITFIFKYSL